MRRLPALLVLVVLPISGAAQTPPVEQVHLPDSTYLRITLELARHATFSVPRIRTLRTGGEQRQMVNQAVNQLDVIGCVLEWREFVRVEDGRVLGGRTYRRVSVPLKQLDLGQLRAQGALSDPSYREDPDRWQILFYSKVKPPPIVVVDLDNGSTRRERRLELGVYGQDAAHLMVKAIADAARRCDTWNTAPMKPRVGGSGRDTLSSPRDFRLLQKEF